MKHYYIVCDVSLCHDCNNCFMACKDEHVDNEWLPYTNAQPRHGHRWMNILRKERGQNPRIDVAYLPMPCQHCEEAYCIKQNPTCISRREDGIVQIDIENAKGASSIVDFCPYGAMYWNAELNVAQKCTMCAHILDGDSWEQKVPRCVHSCPTNALEFYHIEPEEMEKKINDEALERYKPEYCGGKGGVYYKNLYRFEKLFIAGGLIKGDECYEGAEVILSGRFVNIRQVTDCFGDFKFDGLDPGEYTVSVDGKQLQTVTVYESLNLGNLTIND